MKRFAFLSLAGLFLAGCQSDRLATPSRNAIATGEELSADLSLPAPDADGLRVMQYNLYLGTNFGPIFAATNEQEFGIAVVRAYAELQQTNFPARAGKIADQIAKVKPDLLGIEEVALWSVSAPYAGAGPPTAPFVVQYDFLQILLDTLAARGLPYTAPAVDTTSDVAAPVPLFDESGNVTGFLLVRFQDRDAVLVRDGFGYSDPQHGVYQTYLPLSLLGQETGIYNGWSSVRASKGGRTFRFLATHLNAEYGPVNTGQAQELAGVVQGETDPVILVGDFNSGPGVTPAFEDAYDLLAAAGFSDLWLLRRPSAAGLTSGPNDGVGYLNAQGVLVPWPSLDFQTRVDLVLVKDAEGVPHPVHAQTYGYLQSDRTATGLWPTDHAAVGMVFKLADWLDAE